MIVCKNLNFSYEGKKLLTNLSFSLKKGKIGALIGPSGSGKSTLFRILMGLETPESGQVLTNGAASCLRQEEVLLPWRNILANVCLPMELTGSKCEEQALSLLKEMGLQDEALSYPDELSGGMRQRVCLAMSLIRKRPLLLLDEPFSSLDVALREELYLFLQTLHKKHYLTILLITHDFRDALCLADHIFLLRQGRISMEWEISDEERNNPEKVFELTRELKTKLSEFR